jgi:hypothetical protein
MKKNLCICLVSSIIFTSNAIALLGGDKEVAALAKLFTTDSMSVQRISVSLDNSDQAFFEKISQNLSDVVKKNPAAANQLAKFFQPKDEADKKAGGELLRRQLNLTDSECERLLAIVEFQRNPMPRQVGDPIAVQVKRIDNIIHFEIQHSDSTSGSDEGLAAATRLLTSLKLRADATGAELMKCDLGPAEWIETTANDNSVRKGLEWQGRGIKIPREGLVLQGNTLQATKVDATVWFVYDSRAKQTEISIAIWPAGGRVDAGDFTKLIMLPAPRG